LDDRRYKTDHERDHHKEQRNDKQKPKPLGRFPKATGIALAVGAKEATLASLSIGLPALFTDLLVPVVLLVFSRKKQR
jgi:hypothetical protein